MKSSNLKEMISRFTNFFQNKKQSINKINNKNQSFQIPPASDLIGFATTGQFSYFRGKPFGFGFCHAILYHRMTKNNFKYLSFFLSFYKKKTITNNIIYNRRKHLTFVLIRNKNSKICYPAVLSLRA